MLYMKDYLGRDFIIPIEDRERFVYLNNKMSYAKDGGWDELFLGLSVTLYSEFKAYEVILKKGQIWHKKKESWLGNDDRGTPVKLVYVSESFVGYKKFKRFFGLNISVGRRYMLNKFTFFDIYGREDG